MNAMLKPREDREAWPCFFCWGKRTETTTYRDECGYPICQLCAGDSHRQLSMPSFVRDHILELES